MLSKTQMTPTTTFYLHTEDMQDKEITTLKKKQEDDILKLDHTKFERSLKDISKKFGILNENIKQ